MAATKTAARRITDTYFALVRKFPLTHVRDEAHLDEAQETIDRLLSKELDEGGQAYLDALTDLVEIYEDNHHEVPDASEADVLRFLMEARGLTQKELARQAKIALSTVSAVLSGARSLTKKQIMTMADFFHVPPAAFLPAR